MMTFCWEAKGSQNLYVKQRQLCSRKSISMILIRAEPVVDALVLIMTSATATQVSSKSPGTRRVSI